MEPWRNPWWNLPQNLPTRPKVRICPLRTILLWLKTPKLLLLGEKLLNMKMEILLLKENSYISYTSSYVVGFASQTVKGSTIQQASWKKNIKKSGVFVFPHVPKHRTKNFRRNSKLLTVLEAQQLFAFPMGDVGLARVYSVSGAQRELRGCPKNWWLGSNDFPTSNLGDFWFSVATIENPKSMVFFCLHNPFFFEAGYFFEEKKKTVALRGG